MKGILFAVLSVFILLSVPNFAGADLIRFEIRGRVTQEIDGDTNFYNVGDKVSAWVQFDDRIFQLGDGVYSYMAFSTRGYDFQGHGFAETSPGVPAWRVEITNRLLTGVYFLDSVSSAYADVNPSSWTFAGGGMAGNFHYEGITESIAPVPEPATMLLLGSGLAGLIGLRRKFRK